METNFFKAPIHLLHLEDNEIDRVLVREMLAADGLTCEWKVVETRQEFRSALAHASFSLIISDFSLPSFDGMSALMVARELAPQTPFIFFSGTIGEEIAVESLKNGATDYILKQRPQRLVAAVRNALKAARERTRRLRAENELQKAQERFQIISRATNDVIWEWDIGANSVWVSDNFGIAFGHQTGKEGMHPDQWFDLIHPDDKKRVLAGISSLLASRGRVWWSEYRLRRSDGAYTHIYDRASLILDGAHKPKRVIGLKIDVSEQKQAEEKIREQAELLDKAQDAIIVCTLDRKITFWNQGAERIYGWSREAALGKNIRELLFRGKLPWQMEEAAKNPEASGEWMGELEGFTESEQAVIVQTRTTLIRDEQGRPKSMLIISTDITEHKKLEEQFLRSQRLESLGALVSGIAHDLNNTLVPIMIGIEVLQGENQSENATAMLQTMKTSARRSAEMIKQMLAFARGDDASKVMVQADRLVKEMIRIISDTFPKSIQCRSRVAQDSWLVLGLPTQLYQVLLNLCVNARDAMPNGGNLVLHTENVVVSPERAEVIRGGKPGNYLCVTVSDTGTGIAPENLEKIFQPFFSTKATDKGTGLGLSTCQNIINSHNGFISVISQPGVGTEFKVYLPATEVKAPPPPVEAPALPTGQGECILVVDDEQSTLAIVRAALENYRYTVLTAASGAEAVGCFLKQSGAIQLVITDLAMPFMNGGETIDSLKKIRPDIKILVASGAEAEGGPILERVKNYPIIFKPFTNETLIKSVQSALGTAPTGAT
jgi:two-component system, cell cycle sensor histidine kinase and response regulator CckA